MVRIWGSGQVDVTTSREASIPTSSIPTSSIPTPSIPTSSIPTSLYPSRRP